MAVRKVWIWSVGAWRKAERVADRACLVKLGDGSLAIGRNFPQKHNGRSTRSTYERLPHKRTCARPGRKRVPAITVEAVAFRRPGEDGDYAWQLEQAAYNNKLHIYNENIVDQRNQCTFPGAGNACARPYRPEGKSIGMPTGTVIGYRALDELVLGTETAKDTIDAALSEIAEHILRHPGRFDTILYCVNERDDRKLIGCGTFHVDLDVRAYITEGIQKLPQTVAQLYESRRARG